MSAVRLENVTVSYARHPAVHHVSGRFGRGSLTAVTGPNGAGKSTLLKAIAGILTPDEGTIHIEENGRRHIAYLPQASDLQRDFPLSLLHMVATGAWHATGGRGAITASIKSKAAEALHEVGLGGFGNRALTSLSAGQFQRALFARLLIQDAPLLLLDEPFNAVDAETTRHLLSLVKRWHGQGRTVICVLHDFEQIRAHFPDCLLLARECVAWESSHAALAPEKLGAVHFLRDSMHRPMEPCQRISA